MPGTKCPLCGSASFYTKNSEDHYEIYEFDLEEEEIVFTSEAIDSELPDIEETTETYCNRCAWHGQFGTLKGKRSSYPQK